MEYSQETQNLIDRQCRNVERKDFILDKKLSEELILKTYDLFVSSCRIAPSGTPSTSFNITSPCLIIFLFIYLLLFY